MPASHPCSCITDTWTNGGLLLAEEIEGGTAQILTKNARLPLLATVKDLEKPAEDERRGPGPPPWSSERRFRVW
jgi:hypothetical protein